jgi:hypothetical protein
MAVYRTLEPRVHERMADSANVKKTLTEMGALLSPDFESIGVPFINFGDSTRKQGEAFDPAHFKGKLVLGGVMNNSDIMHAPSGPCRITIIRSGPGEDECGRIVVGASDLIGTAMVSYVGITIGDRVHLEPRVTIMDSGGHPADRRLQDCPENRKSAPIVIEDDAWIGYGATIMPGVTIGHHAIVAPGSVVMWNVPAHGAVMGNPAKSSKVYRKYLDGQQTKE